MNGTFIGSTVPDYNPSCNDYQAGDFTITIQDGENVIDAYISDNFGSYHGSATYYGNPPPPTVTPDGQARSVYPASSYNYSAQFTVTNTDASHDYTFNIAVACTGIASGCSAPTQLYLGAGQAGSVNASYAVSGAPGATGTVTLTASNAGASDAGSFNLTMVAPPAPTVTPDAQPATLAFVSGATQQFAIFNGATLSTGTPSRTYNIGVSCTGSASACSVNPSQLTVGQGLTRYVTVTYSAAGAVGSTGTVTLTATDRDYTTAADPGSLNVVMAPSGPVVARDLCLTIAAGAGAAFECGDLRLAHSLPGVRTLNTPRAPTLLYNSQHAHPYPLITADVTVPSGTLPDSLRATLAINSQNITRSWLGSAWGSGGQTRRVQVGYDAAGLRTGLYGYQLTITRFSGGSGTPLQTVNDTIAIVNRDSSLFGPGWWLAGYEKLYFNGMPAGQAMWVGGDGSVRRYVRAGSKGSDTVYLATPVDHPDTLLHTSANTWVRLLSGGSTVTFTSNGTHRRTTNRLGYRTEFYPDSTGDWKLLRIQLPPDTTLTYDFTYAGSPLRLATVAVRDSAPGVSRVSRFNWVGAGPDSLVLVDFSGTSDSTIVTFQYQAGGTNWIAARRDRRRAITTFTYDAGNRLSSSRLGVPGRDSIILGFCAAEVRGLAACAPSLVAPESAYAIFDGPRLWTDSADIMHFWVDRFGEPYQVRDPYYKITTIARTDFRWPSLGTRVQYPDGRVVGASYDVRGNLESQTDSSIPTVWHCGEFLCYQPVVTTRYTWDQKWDEVTQVTLPNGQLSQFAYDQNNGNRLWQQDGRGSVSRVSFGYVASGNGVGLVRSVSVPGGATDSLFYDALGNVDTTKTPLGFKTTMVNDRLGRTTLARTPVTATVYRVDSTFYNVRGLVYRGSSNGPTLDSAGAGSVIVQTTYNAEGQPLTVTRQVSPDSAGVGTLASSWAYDTAGRRVYEGQPGGAPRTFLYDAAGNVIQATAPLDFTVYDRLNRPTRRIMPQVLSSARSDGFIAPLRLDECYFTSYCSHRYNRAYPWFSEALTVPADTAVFAYDLMGNMVKADNRDARIHRAYTSDGLLSTDSLWIRNYADTAFSHQYVVSYGYDENRRLVSIGHPLQLSSVAGSTNLTQYAYDAQTGQLATVTDLLGKTYHFVYNTRGERISLDLPGGIRDTMVYDLDGRVVLHQVKNYSGSYWKFSIPVLRNDTVLYVNPSRPDRVLNRVNYQDDMTMKYSALGALVYLRTTAPVISNYGVPGTAKTFERFHVDALGNNFIQGDSSNLSATTRHEFGLHERSSRYHAGSERLRAVDDAYVRGDSMAYDALGNLVFQQVRWIQSAWPSWRPIPGIPIEEHANYYGNDGRLHFAEYRRVVVTDTTDHCNSDFGVCPYPYDPAAWFINQYKWPWYVSGEEYRYDALGRRVLVRTRKFCGDGLDFYSLGHLKWCNTGTVRRTVWAGDQELYEIQAYGGQEEGSATAAQMENDTASLVIPVDTVPAYFDPNPLFGRVAYTHGPTMDQPLGLVRLGLNDTVYHQQRVFWGPIDVAPHWNLRGRADLGSLGDGGGEVCLSQGSSRCMFPTWQLQTFAFVQPAQDSARWFGELVREHEDAVGLQYRRNRYVDPATGRFTQRDPIGLAGGMNLYGFASGDPVNYGDPFGLGPCQNYPPGNCPQWLAAAERASDALNNTLLGIAAFFSKIADLLTPAGDIWRAGAGIDAEGHSMGTGARFAAGGLGILGMVPAENLAFRSEGLLARHFAKHAAELGLASKEAYLQGARDFFHSSGIETLVRSNGDRVFFKAATKEFGVLSADGFIRTYFKAEGGREYFLRQLW